MLKIYINCGCGHTPVVSAPPKWRGTARYCMSLCTKFGYDMFKRYAENRLTSCLTALPSSLNGCHGQTVLNKKKLFSRSVQLGLKIIYGRFHDDWVWLWNVKELVRTGLLPVWRLCRQVWLAVTAKRFWIRKSCLADLFGLVWRSYRVRFMVIGHHLWPVDM